MGDYCPDAASGSDALVATPKRDRPIRLFDAA